MRKSKTLETLFREHYAEMHHLAAVILHDPEEAHDIVTDIFSSLLENGNGGGSSRPYLLNAVRNRCLNRLREMDVRTRFRNLYLIENEEASSQSSDFPTIDEIASLLSGLDGLTARAFSMRFIEGKELAEIAESLGVGERMVYKYLRKAIDHVRTKITLYG